MSLNSRAMKYVPTTAKDGGIVTMGFGVEAGDVEKVGASLSTALVGDGNRSFIGVIARTPHDVTPSGNYVNYSSDDMVTIRLHEAIKAANVGSYQALYLLSGGELHEVSEELVKDFVELLNTYRPEAICTFSPFDRDGEHLVLLKALLKALTLVEDGCQPAHFFAVNSSGDLGELFSADELVRLDLKRSASLIQALVSVYDSLASAGTPLVPGETAIDLVPFITGGEFDLSKIAVDLFDRARARLITALK